MIKYITIGILSLNLLFFPKIAISHPGKTNSAGCHTNKKTGQYHCHSKSKKNKKQKLRKKL